MELIPSIDNESMVKDDVVQIFRKRLENSKPVIRIKREDVNFQNETEHIETTLKAKKCALNQCSNKVSMIIWKNDEWIPACNDIMKHNLSQYECKPIDSMISEKKMMIDIIKQNFRRYLIVLQISEFCMPKSDGESDESTKHIKDSKMK